MKGVTLAPAKNEKDASAPTAITRQEFPSFNVKNQGLRRSLHDSHTVGRTPPISKQSPSRTHQYEYQYRPTNNLSHNAISSPPQQHQSRRYQQHSEQSNKMSPVRKSPKRRLNQGQRPLFPVGVPTSNSNTPKKSISLALKTFRQDRCQASNNKGGTTASTHHLFPSVELQRHALDFSHILKRAISVSLDTLCNDSSTLKPGNNDSRNGTQSSSTASVMTLDKQQGQLYYILIGIGEVETFHQSNHDSAVMSPILLDLWNNLAELLLLSLRILDHELDQHRNSSLLVLTNRQVQECLSVLVQALSFQWNSLLHHHHQTNDSNDTHTDTTKTENGSNDNASCSLVEKDYRYRFKSIHVMTKCLRDFITGFGNSLHAEKCVGPMVTSILLPLLEQERDRIDNGESKSLPLYHHRSDLEDIQVVVLECLIRLLRWKRHASALLAPLVMDVGVGGQEESNVNPIRKRMLSCMEDIIIRGTRTRIGSDGSSNSTRSRNMGGVDHNDGPLRVVSWTCQCLILILENIVSIDKTQQNQSNKPSNRKSNELNVTNILKWIHESLQNNQNKPTEARMNHISLRCLGFKLLRLICVLYPQMAAQHWALFLPNGTPSSPSNKNRHGVSGLISTSTSLSEKVSNMSFEIHENITLISIISSEHYVTPTPTSEEKIMVMHATRELIRILPLRLWCSISKRSGQVSCQGYLSGRIESSLVQVMNCISRRIFLIRSSEEVNEMCRLIEMIMTSIPFLVYTNAITPAVNLLKLLGEYIVLERNDGIGLVFVAVALRGCMGGVETPQGKITPLPIPTRQWLTDQSSEAFTLHILQSMLSVDSMENFEEGSLNIEKANLLHHLIRSATWLFTQNGNSRTIFQGLINKLRRSKSSKIRLLSVKFINGLIEGKTMNNVIIPDEFTKVIFRYLESLLQDSEGDVRCCTLSAYGSLGVSDWKVLLMTEDSPLKYILQLCLEYTGDPLPKVRSEACRAVGKIITISMDASLCHDDQIKEQIPALVDNAIQVTKIAVSDSNSGVRSMSLFALGNFAVELVNENKSSSMLHNSSVTELCHISYQRLKDDKDDKVIGNAIRATGYFFFLVDDILSNSSSIVSNERNQWMEQFGDAAAELGSKINAARNDALGKSTKRSWKQRSYTKKHAWGACQALSFLLQCSSSRDGRVFDKVTYALQELILCIIISSVLNAKITIGALAAIKKVPDSLWEFSSRAGLAGCCLANCLVVVTKTPQCSNDIYTIMEKMIHCSNDNDLRICLQQPEISLSCIDFFYGWMVEKRMMAPCFAKFAIALEQSYHGHDVSLVQKFQSRAVYAERKQTHGTRNGSFSFYTKSEDENEDEL